MDTTEPTPVDEEWVTVGHYQSLRDAYDHGLVVLAMGEACRVAEAETAGEYDLQAEPVHAPRVLRELDVYSHERFQPTDRFAHAADWSKYSAGWWLSGIWALLLLVIFSREGANPSLVDLGASSSVGLVSSGEWWRPFTALFLHADLPHLAGNLASGFVFASLVSKALGPLKAWAMILACGALGNVITAYIMFPDDFRSIGASTAVFAALGILSGLGVAETLIERRHLPWARIAAPVLGGLILLGWLGSGSGPNTDVLGHVCGFGSGLVVGAAYGTVTFRAERHLA